jgi:chromosome segregation ATPase
VHPQPVRSPSSHRLVSNLIRDLKQERDEIALQIHLAKKEAQDQWADVQDKLTELEDRFDPVKDAVEETGEDVWDALKLLGSEIKDGFRRVREAI